MRIEKLSLKAGSTAGEPGLVVNPSKITVFIGPNNGGKSAALREIHQRLNGPLAQGHIFSSIQHSALTEQEFQGKLNFLAGGPIVDTNAHITLGVRGHRQQVYIQGLRPAVFPAASENLSPQFYEHVLKHFVLNLDGGSRLGLVQEQTSQHLRDPPRTTIAALFADNNLRATVSHIVHEAFGRHLVIDATGMSKFQYALADVKPAPELERSFGEAAIEFFGGCTSLQGASDGTKAFIGIVTEIIAGFHDVLLIDEPEAFLHPALAHLLGSEIAKHISGEKQLFAATHSPHFLMGCMSAGLPVDIVRLTYKSGEATARLLPAAELQPMMHDPLLKSIGVMSALFYESAVVVEADSDRAFYDEVNSRLSHYGTDGIRHTTFLNAHNKQEAAYIARVLRNLGIPAPMVLDIDWIKEDGKVAKKYFAAAGVPEGLQAGLMETRRQVRASLERLDGDYKTTGGISRLSGGELATAKSFFDEMDAYGLFTVRNGELESWLPTLGAKCHKSLWLGEIFKRMGANPLDAAFVRPASDDVWEFIRSIGRWIRKHDRRGMLFVAPIVWETD